MSMDTYEEKSAGHQVPSSTTLHSIALRQGLSLAQALAVWAGLDGQQHLEILLFPLLNAGFA